MNPQTPSESPAAVRLQGVSVKRGDSHVLEDISLEVPVGAFVGIVGPNGAGKTTLLKTILGLVSADSGEVEVLGQAPAQRQGNTAQTVGYVPQLQAVDENFPASVLDVVMMGRLYSLGPFQRHSRQDRAAATDALAMVGAGGLAARPVGRLSGGELRRVMLAQALCAGTRLLLLDEPTSGLDLPAEHEFYALLRRLHKDLGLTVLAVSHDIVALGGQADTLLCINRRMHIHGNPEDVVHSHAIKEAYSCEFDFLAGELAHHEGGHGGENH